MIYPKKVQIAWNALHVIEKFEYIKTYEIMCRINERYSQNIPYDYLRKIISDLAVEGLILSKPRVGIKRCRKSVIYLLDVYKALNIPLERELASPAGKIGARLFDILAETTIRNF